MSAYPRLNRAALRAAVRELTAIYSTDVVSDARINDSLNQALYRITRVAENFTVLYKNLSLGGPILVPYLDGITYRFPGWKWDNTTQFPTSLNSDLYLESDGDTAPWDDGSFDMCLVYAAAADVLSIINDDSKRGAEFTAKYTEIANGVVRDQFVNWNAALADYGLGNTAISGYQEAAHLMYALGLISSSVTIDSNIDVSSPLWYEIQDERNALYAAFNWPASVTNTFNSFVPYSTVFAYGAAAKVAKRMGMPADLVESLNSNYNMYKDALLREKLYSVKGGITHVENVTTTFTLNSVVTPITWAGLVNMLRTVLQDYSKDIPEGLLYSMIYGEYTKLALQREWPWMTLNYAFTLSAGTPVFDTYDLGLGIVNRIQHMYYIEVDDKEVVSSELVYPIPHSADRTRSSSKYRYEINDGLITITPTPTETTFFRMRAIVEEPSIPSFANEFPWFDLRFATLLVYRAAVAASEWSDYAKKMAPTFDRLADELFEAMVTFYLLDRSTEPLQLGSTGLEERRYMPWFRPA